MGDGRRAAGQYPGAVCRYDQKRNRQIPSGRESRQHQGRPGNPAQCRNSPAPPTGRRRADERPPAGDKRPASTANFVVYRFRRDERMREHVGRYRYCLRITGGQLKIARREAIIDALELGSLGSVSFILWQMNRAVLLLLGLLMAACAERPFVSVVFTNSPPPPDNAPMTPDARQDRK
ncbi:MAG: aromatic-ring-hydroxylating dioxygenase subunit beta [Burkholderiales bacterium]